MAHFEIKLSRNKKFYFVLLDDEGIQVIKSQRFPNIQGVRAGIKALKKNANDNSDIIDHSDKFHPVMRHPRKPRTKKVKVAE